MKTQVIQLDPHDDVISIRDKMSWAKTPRILLVFPRRSPLRLRNLDLRLLRRHASLLGAQVAFVSRSNDLRRLAEEEAIPSFRRVATAQRKRWNRKERLGAPERQAPPPDLWQMRREVYSEPAGWQDHPAARIAFFSVAVLIVLILLVLFLPSASVQLTPTTRVQTLAIPVSADASVTEVNLAGSLPARTLSTFLERSQTAKTSGILSIPDSHATGTVRFRNLTNDSVLIPAGTVVRTLSTPAVRFATTAEASVAAASGKTQDVPVQAVNGGAAGNLPAEKLVAIEGDLGVSLAVTNPNPTTGGTDRQVSAPTAADRAQLRQALENSLLEECKSSFQNKTGQGSLLFPDTLAISKVSSETFLPAEGQPGDTLSLTLNIECQVRYASVADLKSLAEMGLEVNLPAGFEPLPDDAIAFVNGAPKTDADGITHWTLQAQRILRARVEPLSAVELARGRTPSVASQELLSSLPLDTSPQIKLTPSWWPWLPLFPFRITVSVE